MFPSLFFSRVYLPSLAGEYKHCVEIGFLTSEESRFCLRLVFATELIRCKLALNRKEIK